VSHSGRIKVDRERKTISKREKNEQNKWVRYYAYENQSAQRFIGLQNQRNNLFKERVM